MNLFSRLPSTWLEIEGAFVAFPLPPSLPAPFLLLRANCSIALAGVFLTSSLLEGARPLLSLSPEVFDEVKMR